MKKFFSILIPVYNQVGLMDKCINSLKSQTFGDFEIIIVDDGSTDESLTMLKEFAKQDDRIIILQHETNKSLASARYTAMEKAQGEYILFLDSDDYYFDYTCEKIHDYLVQNPVDIVRFSYYGILANDRIEFPLVKTKDPYLSVLKGEINPSIWKNCYSKRVIKTALKRTEPFYCNMGEDVFWGTVLCNIAESFGMIDEFLYNYLIGEGMSTNLSRQTYEKLKQNVDSSIECGRQLVSYFEKYDKEHLAMVHKKIIKMKKHVLMQGCITSKTIAEYVDKINLYNTEDAREVFEYGCNKLIPFAVRMGYGLTDEKMDELGIAFDRNIYP